MSRGLAAALAHRGEAGAAIARLPGEAGLRVVLDLSELSFIAAAGFRAIEGARNGLRARGIDLVVCRPQRALRRVLALCALDSWLAEDTGLRLQPVDGLRTSPVTRASLVPVSRPVDGDDAEGDPGAVALG